MPLVACPSCGERGNIPDHLVGKKIRCHKCGTTFPSGEKAAPLAVGPVGESIEVDGLDASSWATSTLAVDANSAEPTTEFAASTETGEPAGPTPRQYKILTPKDRWFEGKFDLARLEDALNHYAGQGWVVRGMATPQITGFSGGPREEFVILLER